MVKEQITPQAVRQMFELDFSEQEKGTAMSHEDIQFCETVESGIVHLEDLHYEMPLPFKHLNIQLPNNYAQAEKCLIGLKRRLKADERYYADYCSFMSDIISKGYASKVDDEFKDEVGRTWYLPHHGIYHLQKAKVRVVFDCSATFDTVGAPDTKLGSGIHRGKKVTILSTQSGGLGLLSSRYNAIFCSTFPGGTRIFVESTWRD